MANEGSTRPRTLKASPFLCPLRMFLHMLLKKKKKIPFTFHAQLSSAFLYHSHLSMSCCNNQLHNTTLIINTFLSLSRAQDTVPTRTLPFIETTSQEVILIVTQLWMLRGSSSKCSTDTIRMWPSLQPAHNQSRSSDCSW